MSAPGCGRTCRYADKVLLHCRGGLVHTGTIAARLLAELGVPAADAVRRVRKAQPGAIETPKQKVHALLVRAVPLSDFREASLDGETWPAARHPHQQP